MNRTALPNASTVTLLKCVFTTLANASLPLDYWDDAFDMAVFLINHLPSDKNCPAQAHMSLSLHLLDYGAGMWPKDKLGVQVK